MLSQEQILPSGLDSVDKASRLERFGRLVEELVWRSIIAVVSIQVVALCIWLQAAEAVVDGFSIHVGGAREVRILLPHALAKG